MPAYLIIGNIFSLLSVICIAISATKKSKKDFMYWQIGDALFGIASNIALSAFAALVINTISLIRNILAYKSKLTKKITTILVIISVVAGLWVNNLAFIGLLPIITSTGYTLCVYLTKNEKQMRWALVAATILWFTHNFYVQAYPSAIANIILCSWTCMQIYKNRR